MRVLAFFTGTKHEALSLRSPQHCTVVKVAQSVLQCFSGPSVAPSFFSCRGCSLVRRSFLLRLLAKARLRRLRRQRERERDRERDRERESESEQIQSCANFGLIGL